MKKIILILILLAGAASFAQAQILSGIGTKNPTTTLEVIANAADNTVLDGITIPKLSCIQIVDKQANSATPYGAGQAGTIVYITDVTGVTCTAAPVSEVATKGAGFYVFNGTEFVKISLNSSAFTDNWQKEGNSGTNPANDFIGTTDAIDFVTKTSNVERMRILAAGNVGIGTATPLTKLSITPSAVEAKITLFDGGDANNHYGFGISAGQLNYTTIGHHVFHEGGKNAVGGTERMRIQQLTGNVGIGIDLPTEKLHVNGNTRILNTNIQANEIEIATHRTTDGFTFIDFHSAAAATDFETRILRHPGADGHFSLQNTGNGVFELTNGGTGNMYLDNNSDASVGMLVDNANNAHFGDTFDANAYGKVQITRPTDQGDNLFNLSFVRSGTQVAGMGFVANSSVFGIQNTLGNFSNFSEEGIFLLPTGTGTRIGIGVSAPSNKLHVNGLGRFGADTYIGSGTGLGYYMDAANGAYRSPVATGLNTGYFFQSNAGANTTMYVGLQGAYAGNVGIGTAAPNAQLHLANTAVNRKIVLWQNADNDHDYYGFGINAATLRYQAPQGGNHRFYVGTSATASTLAMTIDPAANVGIGVQASAPYKLHVAGNSHFGDATDGTSYGAVQITRPADQGDNRFHLSFIRNSNSITGMGYLTNSDRFAIQPANNGTNAGIFMDPNGDVTIPVQMLGGGTYGDVKSGFQKADHNGWVLLNGRLIGELTAAQQARALTLLGGGITNLPGDPSASVYLADEDANPATVGGLGGGGTTGATNQIAIGEFNLPNLTHDHGGAVVATNTDHLHSGGTADAGVHNHNMFANESAPENFPGPTNYLTHVGQNNTNNNSYFMRAASTLAGGAVGRTYDAGNHAHTFTTGFVDRAATHSHTIPSQSLGGNSTAISIKPYTLDVNHFVYLGL